MVTRLAYVYQTMSSQQKHFTHTCAYTHTHTLSCIHTHSLSHTPLHPALTYPQEQEVQVNHLLHCIICIFCPCWIFVWLLCCCAYGCWAELATIQEGNKGVKLNFNLDNSNVIFVSDIWCTSLHIHVCSEVPLLALFVCVCLLTQMSCMVCWAIIKLFTYF